MKKTIFSTALVLGLGISSITAGHSAEAADINKEELAQLAQNESSELNNAPIHEGAYSYSFDVDGVNYNFDSDGTYYTWSYGSYTLEQPAEQTVKEAPVQQETEEVEYTQETEQVSEPVENTQPAEPVQNEPQEQTQDASQSPSPSGGQDWGALAQCESGGDPNAVSPSGTYHGLYQFDQQTWESVGGTGSPSSASAAEQTERAQQLYSNRGAQPWPVCGANL